MRTHWIVVILASLAIVNAVGLLCLTSGEPGAGARAWWTDRQAGVFGGVAGCIMGLQGALVGILAPKGKCRSLVLGSIWLALALGACCLGAVAAALARHQPYAVWYPLALTGALCVTIYGNLLRAIVKSYELAELRAIRERDLCS